MPESQAPLTKKIEFLIHSLRTRHGRKNFPSCVCDGLRCSSEIAHLAPHLIEHVFLREDTVLPFPVPVSPVVLSREEFERIAPTVNSQGIIVVSRKPEYVSLSTPLADPFVLVLDRVGDPGNFGTILRTARAIGLHEVWFTKGSADPFSDKVLRSASGAQYAVKLRKCDDLESMAASLRELGIQSFFRTLPASGNNIFLQKELFNHSAIILGAEANGVGELERSNGLNIPMPGDAESLNVAQAATVILFEYVRRQFC